MKPLYSDLVQLKSHNPNPSKEVIEYLMNAPPKRTPRMEQKDCLEEVSDIDIESYQSSSSNEDDSVESSLKIKSSYKI